MFGLLLIYFTKRKTIYVKQMLVILKSHLTPWTPETQTRLEQSHLPHSLLRTHMGCVCVQVCMLATVMADWYEGLWNTDPNCLWCQWQWKERHGTVWPCVCVAVFAICGSAVVRVQGHVRKCDRKWGAVSSSKVKDIYEYMLEYCPICIDLVTQLYNLRLGTLCSTWFVV